jgi:hypothetical protein
VEQLPDQSSRVPVEQLPLVHATPSTAQVTIGLYATRAIPVSCLQFKPHEYKKYRDAVCKALHLTYERIDGDGNCFFASVSALLLRHRELTMDAHSLRQVVVGFLRECHNKEHGILGERCETDMEEELGHPLESNSRKTNGLIPSTCTQYLDLMANDGVWVQGYHWPRAVAALFSVCVAVVIHGHASIYLFGETDHECVHLYKRDAITHYEALHFIRPEDEDEEDQTALLALASAANSSTTSDMEEKSLRRTSLRKTLATTSPRTKSSNLQVVASAANSSTTSDMEEKSLRRTSLRKTGARTSPRTKSSNLQVVEILSSSDEGDHPKRALKQVVQPATKSLRINPVPTPNPVATNIPKVVQPLLKPKAVSGKGTPKIGDDDTLMVVPPTFSAQGWEAAKLVLIGLMNKTGHQKAFVRTSKTPPKHTNYWAKIICDKCDLFLIGSSNKDGVQWTVNSHGHGVCTSGQSSILPLHSVSTVAKICARCSDDVQETFASCDKNHIFCSDCFEDVVRDATTGDNAGAFLAQGCIVECRWCVPKTRIDMKKYASVLKPLAYQAWVNVRTCSCVHLSIS